MIAGLRWSWIGLAFGPGKPATGFQMVSCWIPIVTVVGVVICATICWHLTGRNEFLKVVVAPSSVRDLASFPEVEVPDADGREPDGDGVPPREIWA